MSTSRLSLKGLMFFVAIATLLLGFVGWARLWTGTRCVASSLRVVHPALRPGDTSTSNTPHFTIVVFKFANGGSVYCLDNLENARGPWYSCSGNRIKINGRTVQVQSHSEELWAASDHGVGERVIGWEEFRYQLSDFLTLNYDELNNVWSEIQQLKTDKSKTSQLP